MSTHGMITATSAAQATFSKYDRNQKPNRTSANSLERLKTTSRSASRSSDRDSDQRTGDRQEPGFERQRQQQQNERERCRDEDERDEEDIRPEPGSPEVIGAGGVRGDRRRQARECECPAGTA